MGIEDREAKWDAAMLEARKQGKDYITRSYPEFNARFIECVVEGCGWTDCLPDRKDWHDDPHAQTALFKHTTMHREEGK